MSNIKSTFLTPHKYFSRYMQYIFYQFYSYIFCLKDILLEICHHLEIPSYGLTSSWKMIICCFSQQVWKVIRSSNLDTQIFIIFFFFKISMSSQFICSYILFVFLFCVCLVGLRKVTYYHFANKWYHLNLATKNVIYVTEICDPVLNNSKIQQLINDYIVKSKKKIPFQSSYICSSYHFLNFKVKHPLI